MRLIDSTAMSTTTEPAIKRSLIYVSLALALLLVAGVLVGSKMVMQKLNNAPVALPELPSPMAESPECAALVDSLPQELSGHQRANLAEPVPPGAAVWQSSSTQRITLRCGVDMPLGYTELTPTVDVSGARWMVVRDPAPGADMATWFSVDTSPVIAVTASSAALGHSNDPVSDLDLSAVEKVANSPAPAPLSQLEAAPEGASEACGAFVDTLPATLGDGYERLDISQVSGVDPATAAGWGGNGVEPVVVRCGVAPPPTYAPGAQLTQVNDVPWFEETSDDAQSNTPSSVTLYALGRVTDLAVSLPTSAGNGALTVLSDHIARTLPED